MASLAPPSWRNRSLPGASRQPGLTPIDRPRRAYWRLEKLRMDRAMAVAQRRGSGGAWQDAAPGRRAAAGRRGKLSDIVVADGKVFFSITVDAAAVQRGSRCASAPKRQSRAVPGVQSAMVALTAERAGGARARGRSPPHGAAQPRAAAPRRMRMPGPSRQGPAGHSRRRRDHRGRLRQRRRRQIDHRGQSRARPARPRPQGRHARCRHLRPVAAQAARHPREAADHRRHAAEADRALRPDR